MPLPSFPSRPSLACFLLTDEPEGLFVSAGAADTRLRIWNTGDADGLTQIVKHRKGHSFRVCALQTTIGCALTVACYPVPRLYLSDLCPPTGEPVHQPVNQDACLGPCNVVEWPECTIGITLDYVVQHQRCNRRVCPFSDGLGVSEV